MQIERLQAIKDWYKDVPFSQPKADISELIAAVEQAQLARDEAITREADQFTKDRDKLEQAQAELAEAIHEIAVWENIDKTWQMTGLCQIVDERNALRAQLAEANELSDKLGISCAKFLKENNDYRVQLDGKDRLEAQLAEAQAELAEAERLVDFWFNAERRKAADCNMLNDVLAALRVQLAEANEWRDTWKERCLFGIKKLREGKKQLAASQAENKRLRYMKGFTPDKARDDE